MEAGHQHSAQPADVARKTARHRHYDGAGAPTKVSLMEEARRQDLPGRSKMGVEELRKALGR